MPFIKASVSDFILSFGELETLELSELEDPNETTVNQPRIQEFLDQADLLLSSKEIVTCINGKAMIRLNYKRYQLDIARYYADVLKVRPDVKERYEMALDEINKANTPEVCSGFISRELLEDLELLNIKGRFRSRFGSEELSRTAPSLKTPLIR